MNKKELTIEDILDIVVDGIESDDSLPEKIKNIVEKPATKQQKITDNKNQDNIKNLKEWAANYLNNIATELAKAKKEKQQEDAIKIHQKNLINRDSIQESVDYYKKTVKNNLSNVTWANDFAKKIYELTMTFQAQVNSVLGQITKNVFIITGPDNYQYFFTADANNIFFTEGQHLKLDKGGIKYNISYEDVKQFLEKSSVGTLEGLLNGNGEGKIFSTLSAGKSGQRLFAGRFAQMITESQQIMNQRRAGASSGGFSDDFFSRLQKNSSFRFLFYSTHNKRRKQSKIVLSKSHMAELKLLEKQGIISFEKKAESQGNNCLIDLNYVKVALSQKQSRSVFNIIREGQIGEIYANDVTRPFNFQGQYFELAYRGALGWAKEAFFGAYFGLQIGQHQIRLKEGMAANINKEQFNLLSYLAGTDSARARLTGDYNILLNNQKYAIQIKGEGSGVKVQQFIELARYILKYDFKDAETFLKVIKAFDESEGIVSTPRFTPYQQQQEKRGSTIEPFRKIVKGGLTKKTKQ